MKIFQFIHDDGEMDFVSANRTTEAIFLLCVSQTIDIDEITETEIKEIPQKHWDDFYLTPPEIGELPIMNTMEGTTFNEWMLENNEPGYIAGTS